MLFEEEGHRFYGLDRWGDMWLKPWNHDSLCNKKVL